MSNERCVLEYSSYSIISQNSSSYTALSFIRLSTIYYYPCLSRSFLDISGSFKFLPSPIRWPQIRNEIGLSLATLSSHVPEINIDSPLSQFPPICIPGISLSYNPTCSGAAVSGLLLFVYIVDSIWGSTENINSSRGGGSAKREREEQEAVGE